MRLLFTILFLIISLIAAGQVPEQYIGTTGNRVVARGELKGDSLILLAIRDSTTSARVFGALIFRTDGYAYYYNGTTFHRFASKSYVDSVVAAAGGVTQVNTGYGLSGGPITSTGTLLFDSATVAQYFIRRKDSAQYVTPTRLNDTAAAIRSAISSGTITGSLTAGRVTLSTGTSTVGDDAGFTYDDLLNKATVDSLVAIRARLDRLHLNPQVVIISFTEDSLVSAGNSITVGNNSNPTTDSGYIYRIGHYLGKFNSNLAVSGRGCITAIAAYHQRINPGHDALGSLMIGFNDLRNNDILGSSGYKTRAKIINTFKSFWANHLLKSVVNPTNGSGVTRNGSWSVNWNAAATGGKSVNLGAFTNTTGNYIEYTFTDSTLILGLIGGDGSAGSYIGATVDITIDGSPIETFNLNNQTDGVTDGNGALDFHNHPVVRIYTGLTNTSHTVRITKTAATGYLLVDYFGHLVDRTLAKHQMWFHVPHMQALGYALAPAQSSYAKTDTANAVLDSLFAAMPQNYGALKVATNSVYDTATGTSSDGIHPSDLGHYQIFNAATNSFVTPLAGNQVVTDGSYLYLYVNGLPIKIGMDAELRNIINTIANNGGNGLVGGEGTTNTLPKWSAAKVLADSRISDNGTTILLNGTSQVNGPFTFAGLTNAGWNLNRRDNNTTAAAAYSQAGNLSIFMNSADRLTLTPAGLLGIGTTTPTRTIHSEVSDATTNTVVYPLMLSHITTGTNASGSGVGIEFRNENGTGNNIVTASITNPLTDATASSEDADLAVNLISAGSLVEPVRIQPLGLLQVQTTADPNGAVLDLYRNDVTPIAGDRLGEFHFYGRNSSGTKTQYAALYAESPGVTAGAESGRLLGNITVGGSIVESFRQETSGTNTVTTLSAAARLDGGTKSVSLGDISITPNYFKYQNSVNGQMDVSFYNSNTGTSVYADLQVASGNASGTTNSLRLMKFGNAWGSVGAYRQSGVALEAGSSLSGGMSFLTQHASGRFSWYLGGFLDANERMRLTANGSLNINNTTNTAFGLLVNRSMALEKDSTPIISTMGPNYLLTQDSTTDQINRVLPANIGLLSNPMTTAGDLITGGTSGTPTRLAMGATFRILGVNITGTGLEYKSVSAGSGMSISHTAGDISIGIASSFANAGTYSPSVTLVTNAASATVNFASYAVYNNIVTGSIDIDIDPTGIGAVEVGVALPIASTFVGESGVRGLGNTISIAGENAQVKADVANNRMKVIFSATDVANRNYSITYQYLVTPP